MICATPKPSEVATPNTGDWIWVNHGPGFSLRARARYNPKTTSKRGRERKLHHFAGRSKPVVFIAQQSSYQISVSCVIEERDELGNRAAWESVVESDTALCYRDPLGRRAICTIGDVSFKDETADTTDLSFTLDEIDAT